MRLVLFFIVAAFSLAASETTSTLGHQSRWDGEKITHSSVINMHYLHSLDQDRYFRGSLFLYQNYEGQAKIKVIPRICTKFREYNLSFFPIWSCRNYKDQKSPRFFHHIGAGTEFIRGPFHLHFSTHAPFGKRFTKKTSYMSSESYSRLGMTYFLGDNYKLNGGTCIRHSDKKQDFYWGITRFIKNNVEVSLNPVFSRKSFSIGCGIAYHFSPKRINLGSNSFPQFNPSFPFKKNHEEGSSGTGKREKKHEDILDKNEPVENELGKTEDPPHAALWEVVKDWEERNGEGE